MGACGARARGAAPAAIIAETASRRGRRRAAVQPTTITAFLDRRVARAAALLCAAFCACPPAGAQPAAVDVRVTQSGPAFVIEAALEVPVPLPLAWEVLTDFERMAAFVPNLADSRVVARDGTTLTIVQHGIARFGPLALRFASERLVTLVPPASIASTQTRGTMERVESLTTFASTDAGTRLRYHVEVVPGALYPDAITRRFLGHEVTEQFDAVVREMLRRRDGARAPPP